MLVQFRHAFEGAGSSPISSETTFRSSHAYIDVKVASYALFYVFPIRFQNGTNNYTYHS